MTARERDLPPVRLADPSLELKLLVGAREDLVAEATRVRNRLHADLRVLLPGYGATAANLTAVRHQATVALRLRRLAGVQAELARGRLARLHTLAAEERSLAAQIAGRVEGHPLLALPGAGALVTAKLVGEVGDIGRFRSADAFAALSGAAPIPASSGQTQRMRLNRGGNRQLNRALHTIALTQASHHPPAIAYIARRRAEGKTWREALRALKRQIVRTVFRVLVIGAPPRAWTARPRRCSSARRRPPGPTTSYAGATTSPCRTRASWSSCRRTAITRATIALRSRPTCRCRCQRPTSSPAATRCWTPRWRGSRDPDSSRAAAVGHFDSATAAC